MTIPAEATPPAGTAARPDTDRPAALTAGRASSNAAAMLIGRVAVAVMGWAGTTIVARTLSPQDWGQYSFVFGLLGLLAIATDLGVGRVVLARLIDQPGDVVTSRFATSFVALRTVLGFIGYALAMVYVVAVNSPGDVIAATAVAGLVVVIATPSHALSVLYQSRLKMMRVSMLEAIGQFVQLTLIVVALLFAPHLIVFVVPAVAAEVAIVAGKIYWMRRGELHLQLSRHIDVWQWKEILREAIPLSIGFALATLLTKIDTLILAKMDTFEAVGHYAIGYKFSDLVLTIGYAITTAIATLLVAAWPHRPGAFAEYTRNAFMISLLLGGIAIVGIWPTARGFISLLYGGNYDDAADATRLLVASSAASALSLLAVTVLISAGHQVGYPIVAGISLVVNIGLNIYLIPRWSYNGAAWATVATETAMAVAMWVVVVRTVKVRNLIPVGKLFGGVALIAALTVVGTELARLASWMWAPAGVGCAVVLIVVAQLTRLVDIRKPLGTRNFAEQPDSPAVLDSQSEDPR